ncbi:hypothetical protein QQX98_010069 [Neonectria punicea]|uniref:Acyltransferase MbtK/IucB-like conserved domain-containing protein n=1 Tax=Neonectria punicea TaxID=979145 RepID=A0ABR1GQY2_9HYPO
MASDHFQQSAPIKVCLPHPYLTTYYLERSGEVVNGSQPYQLRIASDAATGSAFPQPLHNDKVRFSKLAPVEADNIDEANNTPWAIARRSPVWAMSWQGDDVPTLAQAWLFLYTFFTIQNEAESFRLRLDGSGARDLAKALLSSMVALEHKNPPDAAAPLDDEVLILRSAFWQGCASPLGTQPIWLPTWKSANIVPHLEYDLMPTGDTFLRHPRRCEKPTPGTLIYSRYIPSLDEHFSLMAVDYENPAHLDLFHTWQNDPRVAKGWMESGTLEHHRGYLRAMHEDPHTFSVFGCFNDTPFAYFEIYWAKEDKMGAHYASDNFDRGRHALVGDDSFRGRHRVMAWWPSVEHYVFLDDHRTENVVGEPRLSNEKILMYEYVFGLHQNKWMDLLHKRANLVVCSRERFFQLCPFTQHLPRIAGTSFGFEPKL